MSIFPKSRARGLRRLICLKYYYVLKQESRFTLELNAAENTNYIKKLLQIKVVENKISYKKVRGCVCLSSLGVNLRGLQDCHVWNIIMYGNGKVDSLYSSQTKSRMRVPKWTVPEYIFYRNGRIPKDISWKPNAKGHFLSLFFIIFLFVFFTISFHFSRWFFSFFMFFHNSSFLRSFFKNFFSFFHIFFCFSHFFFS